MTARAQYGPLEPLMYPPTVSPEYYPPGPGSSYYPYPQPGGPIPLGAPIPGVDNPKKIYDDYYSQTKKPAGDPLVLHSNEPNAFPCEEPNPNFISSNGPQGLYLNLGAMALMRNRMGNGGVAFTEPASATPGISTYPTSPTPTALTFHDIDPNFNYGFRGSIGYQMGDQAVELVGWKIWGTNSFQVAANQDNLYLPFAAYQPPIGIGGGGNNANTWLQVDQVRILDVTDLANVEGNYRFGVGNTFQWLVGLRYLNVSERFDILSDQDGLTVTPPDPRFQITYRVQTHSNIIGPQLGFEWDEPLLRGKDEVPWLSLGVYGKALVGANFYSVGVSVFRADGYTALDNVRNNVTVSGALELGGFLELNPFPSQAIRLRAGYEVLYLINVPVASSEVAFNIQAQPYGSQRDSGSILFNGPFLEFIFNF